MYSTRYRVLRTVAYWWCHELRVAFKWANLLYCSSLGSKHPDKTFGHQNRSPNNIQRGRLHSQTARQPEKQYKKTHCTQTDKLSRFPDWLDSCCKIETFVNKRYLASGLINIQLPLLKNISPHRPCLYDFSKFPINFVPNFSAKISTYLFKIAQQFVQKFHKIFHKMVVNFKIFARNFHKIRRKISRFFKNQKFSII